MAAFARKYDKRLGFGRERLIVKSFATDDAMHHFLNQQGNEWAVSDIGLKAGTYAMAGGRWHDVRKLPAHLMAHL